MKKFLCALLALGMAFAVACGGGGGNSTDSSPAGSSQSSTREESSESSSESESVGGESSESSSEEDEEIFEPDYASTDDLVEYFSSQIGEVTYNTGKDLIVDTPAMDTPIYLGSYSESNVFTVDGGPYATRTLTFDGSGGGVLQANGGILVLKNLTIKNDTTTFEENYYRANYAEFGGKVRFENCKFECSVQLRNDADAEFINCDIKSVAADQYSVWVADGSAKFVGCTFTGYRALKVHEINGMDVINVTVEECFFDAISKKPAIAIDIAQETSTTTIAFIRSEMYACADWARDSLEGVEGFYESDQATTSFDFTATACYLDNALFDFWDGEMIFAV